MARRWQPTGATATRAPTAPQPPPSPTAPAATKAHSLPTASSYPSSQMARHPPALINYQSNPSHLKWASM